MNNDFGYWLQQEREKRGLTQAKLAKLANLNRAVINKIENNQSKPTVETLQSIANALNLPDEVVFRAAGFLRTPADTEYQEEFFHLLSQLSPQERQEILELLRFKTERRSTTIKKSRTTPARSVLKEK
ncbi:MAG: helix-turn-helix transcriptional regulator [Anaerolineae bacterium]|nr:helix-turn-helix transcriptional regulator [Anaerolineae bacterium]